MSKIKLLHISPDFNYSCGVSKYLSNLFEEFSDDEEFEIHFITNGGDRLEEIKQLNIHLKLIPFSKGLNNIFYLSSFKKRLQEYVEENGINIIHTHHRFPEFVSSIISRGYKIKTISTVHSLTRGFRKISFRSDYLIAVSNSVKNHLSTYYRIDENKIATKYNPLKADIKSINKNEAKKIFGLSENDFVFLFVGTVCQRKGFDVLIEAFNKINSVSKNINLLVVGNWEEFDKNIIERHKNILCYDSAKDVNQFYSAADAIVLPSRYEPFPYVMLEAGLFKIPFIGSRTGGIKEFIEDNVHGYLFENENVNDLSKCMNKIISLEKEREMFANQLYKKVLEMTNINKYCSELRDIYSGVFSENI